MDPQQAMMLALQQRPDPRQLNITPQLLQMLYNSMGNLAPGQMTQGQLGTAPYEPQDGINPLKLRGPTMEELLEHFDYLQGRQGAGSLPESPVREPLGGR